MDKYLLEAIKVEILGKREKPCFERKYEQSEENLKKEAKKAEKNEKIEKVKMKKQFFVLLIEIFFVLELALIFNQTIGFFAYLVFVGIMLVFLEKNATLSHSHKMLIFLTIVPIARISEFFIEFDFFWKTAAFYFVISFLVIFYTRRFKINPGYTLKKLWFLPFSLIIGGYLGYAGNYLLNFDKTLNFLVLLPFIAFSEEILFRGMVQNFARKDYGASFSIITTSFLFAIFSLSLGIEFALLMFVCSLIMGIIYDKTGNILLTMPINLIINLLLFIVNPNTLLSILSS
jgi:membrane protease YdiL (CAAX protease family)